MTTKDQEGGQNSNKHDIQNSNPSPNTTYTNEDSRMDYASLRSIEGRTGISKSDVYKFVLKELLDNAVDSHENIEMVRTDPPSVYIDISSPVPQHNNAIKITVKNSNPLKTPLTKEILESIFKIGRYYSSKRNMFRITKGALGDAMKEVLCIPHALAEDMQIEDEWQSVPLTIKSVGKKFNIYLVKDRAKDRLDTRVVPVELEPGSPADVNITEVEVILPILDTIKRDELIDRLLHYAYAYSFFATHIEFVMLKNSLLHKALFATQPASPKWKNLSSIHWYTLVEFKRLLRGLAKENSSYKVYDILYNIIREVSNLNKDTATESHLTLGELLQSENKIGDLYTKLQKAMNAPTTVSLPFNTSKRVRMDALRLRLSRCLMSRTTETDNSKVKYKQATGSYPEGSLSIPFFYEIMIVHDMQQCMSGGRLIIEQSLNCSAVPTKSMIFQTEEDFQWSTPNGTTTWLSKSIAPILENYGYSTSSKTCKKPYSIILMNLVCPKLSYRSYGKSRIDFMPFVSTVVDTTIKACMGGGRSADGKPSKKSVLLDILSDRKTKWILMSTAERNRDWWTQSDVFYATRKKLIEKGYANEEINREYITGLIRTICEYELGVKREDIGIIAADRAQLYFKGVWSDVGLQEINSLVQYGTDMLIIEKEGVVEQLKLFADEYGIALLNTRGFLTEYAGVLQQKAEKEGCNISILTDFDASGLAIACNVPNAFRVGIDFQTLDDLDIDISDVEEEYDAPDKHLGKLQPGGDFYAVYSDEMIEYVEHKRVEINSIMVHLDDHSRFWEWIIDKLRYHFHSRDYTRSVNIPEYVQPKKLQDFNDRIKKISIEAIAGQISQLRKNLSDINEGFLFDGTNPVLEDTGNEVMDIPIYDTVIENHIRHIIESSGKIRELLDRLDDDDK